MLSMDVRQPEETEYKSRQLWRIGSLIEMLKSDEAPALLRIHYESWSALVDALMGFAVGIGRYSGVTWDEAAAEEETRKLCDALSDFLRSVVEGAEKPDGIPGFFGYELVEHEDGWIEVEEGVYHIWTLGARQRLWIKGATATVGDPIIDNICDGILRLSIPYAVWKGQSFKVEAI